MARTQSSDNERTYGVGNTHRCHSCVDVVAVVFILVIPAKPVHARQAPEELTKIGGRHSRSGAMEASLNLVQDVCTHTHDKKASKPQNAASDDLCVDDKKMAIGFNATSPVYSPSMSLCRSSNAI
jgi:hypothetical protein